MSNNMESLDKIDFHKLDTKEMLRHIENWPQMLEDAYNLAESFTLPSYFIKAKKIVLLGMGGSGAANDTLKALLSESTDLLVESIHNYSIPQYVDEDTLVIASSYSGNTEETLAGFIAAYEKGAKLVAITTGGKLKILAEKYKAPLFLFGYPCPPRASFPYLFTLLARVFEKLGHLDFDAAKMAEIKKILEEYRKKYVYTNSLFANPAKILAQKIHGKVAVVYASEKLSGAGNRWKAQLNENGKNFSFYEEFPELNHNALEGIMEPKHMVYVIMLESNFEYERNIIRQNVTAEVLADHKIPVERIKFLPAKDRIGELLLFIMFGDFVSYYLGILNHANPGINDMVDYLKKRLS